MNPFAIIGRFVLFFFRIFVQTVFLAIGQLWANKMRAVLTTLGIIIGVAAVIGVIGGLSGMQRFVLAEFETFGARKMWVWGDVPDEKRTTLSWTDVKISLYEAKLIRDNAETIEMLTPQCSTSNDVTYGEKTQRGVRVRGIWPEWHTIEDRPVRLGRPFSRIDNDERRQVCIINDQAIDELGLNIDPVGDSILIDSRRFLIVGVVETKEAGQMFSGGEARSEVYVPFNTSKMMNPYTWTSLMLQITDPDVAQEAQAEVTFILRKHRGLEGEDENTFEMQVLQQAIEQFQGVAAVIQMIAGAVVSISLLVGGIGIMNIMLVSVSERTREIGLRKAVGARPTVVLLQFLVEAVALCLVGGLIGIGIGQAMVIGLQHMPNSPLEHASVPPWAIALALGFSASVGVIFGMFPAIKAAKLNPIDALRHE